ERHHRQRCDDRWAHGIESAAARRPRAISTHRHRKAVDLRARPAAGLLRSSGRSQNRSRRRAAGLPLVVDRARHREEPDVSDARAARGVKLIMPFLTSKSMPRRTVLQGLGATMALPFLEAMVPAFSLRGTAAAKPAHRFQTF